jgi:chromosome segregation ATPase
MVIMEEVAQYTTHKAELEEKIQFLEAEKGLLLSEVAALKEKVATLELERAASALQSEVDVLKNEKAALEEKVAEYSPAPYEIRPAAEEY